MSLVDRGAAQPPLLVLEGNDARPAADAAEATGNALLERVAAELSLRSNPAA